MTGGWEDISKGSLQNLPLHYWYAYLTCTYHDGQLLAPQQLHNSRDQSCLHHHIDAIIGAISQVRDGPACVCQNLPVIMVQKTDQGGQDLLDGLNWGCWVLVTAQVGQGPGQVSEVASLQRGKRGRVNKTKKLTYFYSQWANTSRAQDLPITSSKELLLFRSILRFTSRQAGSFCYMHATRIIEAHLTHFKRQIGLLY